MRRIARVGLGGLAVLAGACPAALADETHGDVNLPELTPEEIKELGLESAPPSGDTVAPGSQDVDADRIPDNQDTGTPAPEEAEPETPEPAPAPSEAVPAPAAPAPAPSPQAPPAPVATPPPPPVAVPQPPRPKETAPARRRAGSAPRAVSPPPIGRRARPPRRGVEPQAIVPMRRPGKVVAPVPVVQSPRPVSSASSRTVRSGESLWSIATDLLGPVASPARVAAEVERLWRLNRDRIRTGDPDVLPAGVSLST